MPTGKHRVCGGECHTGNEPPKSDRQTVLGCSRVVDGQTKIWRGIRREHIGKDSEGHAGEHSSQIEARRQKRRLILAPGAPCPVGQSVPAALLPLSRRGLPWRPRLSAGAELPFFPAYL